MRRIPVGEVTRLIPEITEKTSLITVAVSHSSYLAGQKDSFAGKAMFSGQLRVIKEAAVTWKVRWPGELATLTSLLGMSLNWRN